MTYTIGILGSVEYSNDERVRETLDRAVAYTKANGKRLVIATQPKLHGPYPASMAWAQKHGVELVLLDHRARGILQFRYVTSDLIGLPVDVVLIFGWHVACRYSLPLLRTASIPHKEYR